MYAETVSHIFVTIQDFMHAPPAKQTVVIDSLLRQSSPTDQKIILDYVQEILRPAWYMCRKHSLIKLRFEFFG